jgi:hypothetical protein
MTSYTITISPNDNSGSSTTLVVQTHDDTVRITDVHLHAGEGLTDGHLPAIDFAQLLRAVRPPTASALPAQPPAVPAVTAAGDAPEGPRQRAPRRTTATSAGRGARPAKATRTSKTPADMDAAPASQPGKRSTVSARRAGKDTQAGGRARRAAATAAASDGAGRAYRRMPGDIREVMAQAPTAVALADHYQVPTHTAQGWMRRVRREDAAA